jgi:hypothetical protein
MKRLFEPELATHLPIKKLSWSYMAAT